MGSVGKMMWWNPLVRVCLSFGLQVILSEVIVVDYVVGLCLIKHT